MKHDRDMILAQNHVLLDKIGPKGMGHGHSFKGMFRNVSAGPTMSTNRLFAGMNRSLKGRCAKKSADHQN